MSEIPEINPKKKKEKKDFFSWLRNKPASGGPAPSAGGQSAPVSLFKNAGSPFGKNPAFSKAAGSLGDRLKNLSKKDMAFVAVGLCVLVAAPVAEHLLSRPSTGDQLTSGFGHRDGSADGGGSVYEPGINSLSQGSPDGTGEIITPLSSRDPASLIIGAPSAEPPAAPPSAPPSDYRDTVRESARNAISEATKSAGAPTVIPKMQAALRSMGSFFSGGEGSRTAGNIGGGKILDTAQSASRKASKRSMVGPVGGAGYRGVASSQNNADKGAFEKLKGQADRAAGNFMGGSGMSSLERAAAESVTAGPAGGGMDAFDGKEYSKPSGSNIQNHHQIGGESLAQMAARMRMQKALEWEFYKKYDIPKKIIDAVISGFASSLNKFAEGMMNGLTGQQGPPARICWGKGGVELWRVGDCGKDKGLTCTSADCVCGLGPEPNGTPGCEKGGGTSGDGGVDPTSGPGGGGGPGKASAPEVDGKMGNGYDDPLKQMIEEAKTAKSTNEPREKARSTMRVAGGFQRLPVQKLVHQLQAEADQIESNEIAAYEKAIREAEGKVGKSKSGYDNYDSSAKNAEDKARTSSLDLETHNSAGVSYEAQQPTMASDFAAYRSKTGAAAKQSFKTAEEGLSFHRAALQLYRSQIAHVKESAGVTLREYNEAVQTASSVRSELGQIVEKKEITPQDEEKVKSALEKIAGSASAPLSKALLWRGAKAGYESFDTGNSRSTEEKAWAAISPWKKAGGKPGDLQDSRDLPPGNLYAAFLRGGKGQEIAKDVLGITPLASKSAKSVESVDKAVSDGRSDMKNRGVKDEQ